MLILVRLPPSPSMASMMSSYSRTMPEMLFCQNSTIDIISWSDAAQLVSNAITLVIAQSTSSITQQHYCCSSLQFHEDTFCRSLLSSFLLQSNDLLSQKAIRKLNQINQTCTLALKEIHKNVDSLCTAMFLLVGASVILEASCLQEVQNCIEYKVKI